MKFVFSALLALCLAAAADWHAPRWGRTAAAHAAGSVSEQTAGARSNIRSAIIRGRVVQGDSGLPVGDAAVSLVPLGRGAVASGMTGAVASAHGQRSIVVDGAGRFEVTGVEAGYYRLVASPGSTGAQYLTGRFPDPRSDDPPVLTIAGHEVVGGVEIRLPRAAVITGRAVDDRGNPIASVAVSAQPLLPGNRRGASRQPSILPATTDDTGSFRLFGLAPGDYLVHARPLVGGHITMVMPGAESVTRYGRRYAAAYYPGTGTPSNAMRIRVGPGDVHGPIEIALTEARLLTLRGTLLSISGDAAPNTPVYLRRAGVMRGAPELEGPGGRPTLADGSFEIAGLVADTYHLSVARFRGDYREFASMRVQLFDDLDGLVVQLQPGVTVKGQVLFEGPPPDSLAGLQISSVPAGEALVDAVTVQPTAAGTFLLEHQHGPTLIRAEGLRGWHLKSVLYGGQDVTDRPTAFVDRGPDVQVVLTNRASTVTGIVRTARGAPVDGAVLLVSEDPAAAHEASTTTRLAQAGGDGGFQVDGVRAGRYLAVALDRDDPSLDRITPEYFDLLAQHATPLVVYEGQPATLTLTLTALRP